jgi:hypothetical protein
MFEAQVAYYLNQYLGRFVEGIDQQSLTCVAPRRRGSRRPLATAELSSLLSN